MVKWLRLYQRDYDEWNYLRKKKELINEKYFLLAFKKIVDKVNNKNSLGEKGNEYDCKSEKSFKKNSMSKVLKFNFHSFIIV